MEPSPAPHESPGKVAENEAQPKSLSRFKALAGMLFATNPEGFKVALERDKAERRTKRGR